jgi:hypothetical protein
VVDLSAEVRNALNPASASLVTSVREAQASSGDRLRQTAAEIESITATAEARVRPYREAQERFWAADRAYREQVARVIAKYGEPSRGVVETRVGGDMQQRDKVSAGNVYTYGSTVPVTDPDIMRAFIFRDLEYERHLAHARLLKMERATMSNPSAGEVARWLLRSLSTVTMAMRALNLAAAEHGTLSAWAYDRGAPVWAYDKSLPDQYKEPTEREQALYAYGWPLLPASTVKPRLYGLSFAPNGETPSGNGKCGGKTTWAGRDCTGPLIRPTRTSAIKAMPLGLRHVSSKRLHLGLACFPMQRFAETPLRTSQTLMHFGWTWRCASLVQVRGNKRSRMRSRGALAGSIGSCRLAAPVMCGPHTSPVGSFASSTRAPTVR